MLTRRRFLQLTGAALGTPILPRPASAQQWPARPIRAIIPFSAGSTIDIIGRIVAEPLSTALGQPIIVDNRGGAGGSIGTAVVAKAEPDGHTILIHASAHSAAPAVYPNAPHHASRAFSADANFGIVPNVVVIAPSKGIKTLKQLVEAAKKGNMTFASAGVGSATHWAAERLRLSVLPAVVATFTVDNRKGSETKTGVFGIDFVDPGTRLIGGGETHPAKLGFAWRRHMGVLGVMDDADNNLCPFQRWSVAEGVAEAITPSISTHSASMLPLAICSQVGRAACGMGELPRSRPPSP